MTSENAPYAGARRKEYREAVKSKFPYERKNSTSRHKDSWSNDSVFKPTYRPTSTGSFIGAFKPPDIPTASHIMEKAYLPQKDIPVATKNNSAHEEFADAEDHMDLEVTLVETSPSYQLTTSGHTSNATSYTAPIPTKPKYTEEETRESDNQTITSFLDSLISGEEKKKSRNISISTEPDVQKNKSD